MMSRVTTLRIRVQYEPTATKAGQSLDRRPRVPSHSKPSMRVIVMAPMDRLAGPYWRSWPTTSASVTFLA